MRYYCRGPPHNSQFQFSLLLLLSLSEYLLQLLESHLYLFLSIFFFGWQIIGVSALIQLVWVCFCLPRSTVSVCHLRDFRFLPFCRKFTQEIYTRARKTNTNKQTQRMNEYAATPSQLEAALAHEIISRERSGREQRDRACARARCVVTGSTTA